MFEAKEGQYYYAPHRRSWGVWKRGREVNGTRADEFISDFATKIQASNFVYKMNGFNNDKKEEQWNEKTTEL